MAVTQADDALDSVRVDIEELDHLLAEVSEAATQVAALRAGAQELERLLHLAATIASRVATLEPVDGGRLRGRDPLPALAQDLRDGLTEMGRSWEVGLDRVQGELDDARARASEVRLLPASTIFPPLERAARDAARTLGRRVDFVASGGDVRLDGHVLLAARDALLHVVRNAVAHGIEPEDGRRAAGKPPDGRVELRVERRGRRVELTCRDDGRGIDTTALRRVAVARGLLGEEAAAALGEDAAVELIFVSGMTTARQVDAIAGRGVGMDVVRDTVRLLKGVCRATSDPGHGTSILLSVPVSLSSVLALLAGVDGRVVGIPFDAVVRSLRLDETALTRSSGRSSLLIDGNAVPFVPLAQVLAPADTTPAKKRWTAIVIRAGQRTLALGADRMFGTEEVLVKALPRLAGAVPLVAGTFLDAEGAPQLLLDPHGLLDAAGAASGQLSAVAEKKRAPILVIDDSLTTRMLEQSILESAGYEVDLATSAEEAIDKAQAHRYGLFVCDVEMPGMNGFEFVARTRADPTLGKIPAILVTSLNAPADRERGAQAGAAAYIVKGEFDQGRLLGLIRDLMG